MSLTFDLTAIIDRDGKRAVYTDADQLRGRTECLIFATIFVGMPQITDGNAETFAARLAAWEHAAGPLCSDDTPLTLAEVRSHIGLRTNATSKTLAQFERDTGRAALDRMKRRIDREASGRAALPPQTIPEGLG